MTTTVTEREGRYTELPWRAEGPDPFGDYNILHNADSLAVAAVVSNMRPAEEVGANAALIVKACNAHEDLVAALRFYVAICGNTGAQVSRQSAQEAFALAEAAIAKASAP